MLLEAFRSGGMCMGLAIERFPAKANEISALMVMAIVGGGIVSAVLGVAQSSFGPAGIVATLGVCIAYLSLSGFLRHNVLARSKTTNRRKDDENA